MASNLLKGNLIPAWSEPSGFHKLVHWAMEKLLKGFGHSAMNARFELEGAGVSAPDYTRRSFSPYELLAETVEDFAAGAFGAETDAHVEFVADEDR